MCEEAHAHGSLAGRRADPRRRPRHRRASRAGRRSRPRSSRATTTRSSSPKAMERGRHPPRAGGLGAGGQARPRRRVRHRLRLRRAQLPAAAVPLALLQQAHRRVRRLAREPRALLARDARGRARGGRRRLRDRRAALRRGARRRRASSSRRGSTSSGSPTTSSTSGTSTSARSPSGRRTRASSRFFPEGYQLEWTGRVREATAKPIVGVGRLTNPDRMAEIIRSGAWDLIGAARPSIADPFLPKKVEEGRYDEIRECIGCNVCMLKAEEGNHIGCTQNATAGEEYRRGWHPERFEPAANRDRDVLVVGAGPAGMECAIVLGKRGFRRVHLVEAEAEIGGIMRWVPQLPGPRRVGPRPQLAHRPAREARERRGAHRHAARRRRRARVRRRARRRRDRRHAGPATASTSSRTSRSPAPMPRCRTSSRRSRSCSRGRPLPGERVVVYDAEGYFMARRARREARGRRAREVEIVTAVRSRGADLRRDAGGAAAAPAPPRPRHRPARRATMLTGIEPGRLTASRPVRRAASSSRRTPSCSSRSASPTTRSTSSSRADGDALAAEGIEAVYRIGDCVAPRIIAEAIFDGHRLGREIDSENPAIPLPYRRERLVLDPVPAQ